jgi:hypothetical protein
MRQRRKLSQPIRWLIAVLLLAVAVFPFSPVAGFPDVRRVMIITFSAGIATALWRAFWDNHER